MSNRIMKTLSATVVSLGMLASAAAEAQTVCTSPADEAAFQVGALKSELTVLAIGCKVEESYNGFVERYRSELVAKDAVVNAWFRRAYGRSAQSSYDSYITLLANEHSQLAQREGTDFCPRLLVLFKEVMSLPNAGVLAEYAAAKDVVPEAVGACQLPVSAAPAATGRRPAPPKKR